MRNEIIKKIGLANVEIIEKDINYEKIDRIEFNKAWHLFVQEFGKDNEIFVKALRSFNADKNHIEFIIEDCLN